MVNVEFNEGEIIQYNPSQQSDTTPFLNRMVMKTGLAKTQASSNVILVAIAIICFLIAGIIIWNVAGGRGENEPLPYVDSQVS